MPTSAPLAARVPPLLLCLLTSLACGGSSGGPGASAVGSAASPSASPTPGSGGLDVPPIATLRLTLDVNQPVAGAVWAPSPVVTVTSGAPGALASFSAPAGTRVSLSLGASEGELTGITSRVWTGDALVFGDLTASQSGAKTLTATLVDGDGVPIARIGQATAPLTVQAAAATSLRFVAAAEQAQVGVPLAPPPRLALTDDYGNPASMPPGATVALGLVGDAGPLRGSRQLTAAASEVSFAGVDFDTPGTYRLQATLGGIAGGPRSVPADAEVVVSPGPQVEVDVLATSPVGRSLDAALQADASAVRLPREVGAQASFAPSAIAPRGLALDPVQGGLTLAATSACDATQTQCTALDLDWAPQPGDLVGHWTFDGTGALADGAAIPGSVGPNLVASNVNGQGLTYVPGHIGGALALDGVDDALLLPSGFPGSASMTFSAWARVDEPRNYAYILSLAHNAQNYLTLHTLGTGYRTSSRAGGGAECSDESLFGRALGVWQHLALTVDGAQATLFLNGNPVAAATSSVVPNSFAADASALGSSLFGTPTFKGALDEVAIWRVALTADQVASLYDRQDRPRGGSWTSAPMPFGAADLGWQSLAWLSGLPAGKPLPAAPESTRDYPDLQAPGPASGLSFLWHLGETALGGVGGGLDFADSAGAANHAQVVNFDPAASLWVDRTFPGALGPFGRALMVGRCAAQPSIVTQQTVAGPSTFSVQAWFASGSSEGGRIIGFGDVRAGATSDPNLRADRHLYLTPAGTLAFGVVSQGVQQVVFSPFSVADKAWHHAVGTLGPDGMTLWVDGQQVAHSAAARAADAYPGAWRLGWEDIAASAWPQAPQRPGFYGLLAEAAVWARPLGDVEVLQLYRRGSERVRLQLRACADAACSANPPWQGRDGTPQTLFSELDNLDAAGPGSRAPSLPLWPTPALPALASHPFMQMRVQMDAGDVHGLCEVAGQPSSCAPVLHSAQVSAAQASPPGVAATFQLSAPPRALASFSAQVADEGCPGGLGFALSLDGVTFYGFSAGVWAQVDPLGTQASDADALTPAALLAFGRQVGVADSRLFVRAYLRPMASAPCALSSLSVGGSG